MWKQYFLLFLFLENFKKKADLSPGYQRLNQHEQAITVIVELLSVLAADCSS